MCRKTVFIFVIVFITVFCAIHFTLPVFAATANPTASTVVVDGEIVSFDAYNINDNNYFKLRDLAFVLNDTAKQFSVGWDGANNAISLASGQPYAAVGGEMASKGAGSKNAETTTSRIYLDGRDVRFTAYNIEGNNYFKLRDIGEAFDFGVDWDGARNTIAISTSKGYTPDGGVAKPDAAAAYSAILNAYAELEHSGYTKIDKDLIGDSLLVEQQNGTYNFGWDELPKLVYALYDIDEDGSPELLIGVDGYDYTIAGIYSIDDDTPESIIQVRDRGFLILTTDTSGYNVIVYATGQMGHAYESFYRLVNAGMGYTKSYLGSLEAVITEDSLRYLQSYTGEEDDELITEEKYVALMQEYGYFGYETAVEVEYRPVVLDWKPIPAG